MSKEEYQLNRNERKHKQGGGILIAVSNDIPSTDLVRMVSPDLYHNEIAVVELLDNSKVILSMASSVLTSLRTKITSTLPIICILGRAALLLGRIANVNNNIGVQGSS